MYTYTYMFVCVYTYILKNHAKMANQFLLKVKSIQKASSAKTNYLKGKNKYLNKLVLHKNTEISSS